MKNFLRFALLVAVSVLFVTACESKPEPKPEETPVPVVVEEPTPEPEPMPEPVLTVNYREYTVKNGDTLSQIAETFYGSKDRAYFFPIIIAYTLDSFTKVNVGGQSVTVNFDDPDIIEPGTVLRIPNFEEFMNSKLHIEAVKPLFERVARRYENKGRPGVAKMLRERANRLGSN